MVIKKNLTVKQKTLLHKLNNFKHTKKNYKNKFSAISQTYNYYNATEFYPDKYVEDIFAARGNWNRISDSELKTTTKPIHFIHINGKYTLNKKIYSIKSELKNLITDRNVVSDKSKLISNISKYKNGKQYILDSYDVDASQIMQTPKLLITYKYLFIKNKVFIFKPVSGYGGANIKIITDFNALKKYIGIIIKKYSNVWKKGLNYNKIWVLQEYLVEPLLITGPTSKLGYKFHIRHYFIFRPNQDKSFFLKRGLIATALKPYKQNDWQNKQIHDTHFYGRDDEIFPNALNLTTEQLEKIYKQIYELYSIINDILKKNAKCFTESHKCFQLFGVDLMITNDYTIKILELNDSPGMAYEDKEYLLDEYKSIIENYMSIIVDDYFPPLNKIKNKFVDDVVYIE